MALMRYHFTIKAIFQYYIVCSVVGIFLCVVDVDDDIVWRGGLVVGRASDLRSTSRGFEARPAATLLRNNLRQVVHTLLSLSPSSIIWYQRKLGSKQAYRVVHQPVSRSLAVFAGAWLPGWLAEISADLRENGSALEVVLHDYALYKSTFTLLTTLLYILK